MASGVHSSEQGLRVHYLTNLGGLVALAGLDTEPPDFLLGALLSIARETAALGPEQRAEVAAKGQVKLDERANAPSNRGSRKVGSERKRSAPVSADTNAGRG